MDLPDPPLPLPDPGLHAEAPTPPGRRPPPLALRAGVAGLLLMIGAVGGMYVQGPVVRAFFAATGLQPGAGALRAPIAVAPTAPEGAPEPARGPPRPATGGPAQPPERSCPRRSGSLSLG